MFQKLKNISSTKNDIKKFAITISVVLLIISIYLYYVQKQTYEITLLLSIFICLFGIFFPMPLKPFYWFWMILGTVLGWIMTRVILIIIYFIILFPIGIFARIFKKNFLELHWESEKRSYWNIRESKPFNKKNYEKQF